MNQKHEAKHYVKPPKNIPNIFSKSTTKLEKIMKNTANESKHPYYRFLRERDTFLAKIIKQEPGKIHTTDSIHELSKQVKEYLDSVKQDFADENDNELMARKATHASKTLDCFLKTAKEIGRPPDPTLCSAVATARNDFKKLADHHFDLASSAGRQKSMQT